MPFLPPNRRREDLVTPIQVTSGDRRETVQHSLTGEGSMTHPKEPPAPALAIICTTCDSGISRFGGDGEPRLSDGLGHALGAFHSAAVLFGSGATGPVLLGTMFADVVLGFGRVYLEDVLRRISSGRRRRRQFHFDDVLETNILHSRYRMCISRDNG